MLEDDRYVRQRRVAEIGDAGQARLLAARVRLPATPAGEVARLYLERAGVRCHMVDQADDPESPHAHCFRDGATRELAQGAWRALSELRRIVGVE